MSDTLFKEKPVLLRFTHEGEEIYLRVACPSMKSMVLSESNGLGEIINLRDGFEFVQDYKGHRFIFYPHRGDLVFPVSATGRIGFRGRLLLQVTRVGIDLEKDVFHVTDVESEIKKWVSNNVPV